MWMTEIQRSWLEPQKGHSHLAEGHNRQRRRRQDLCEPDAEPVGLVSNEWLSTLMMDWQTVLERVSLYVVRELLPRAGKGKAMVNLVGCISTVDPVLVIEDSKLVLAYYN